MESTKVAKREFYQWILSLKEEALSDYDRTFINLLMDSFDMIDTTPIFNDKRTEYLGQLINEQSSALVTSMEEWNKLKPGNGLIANRIDELKTGIQKEDGSEEQFVFYGPYTFVCDSDKLKKSHLYEELEYALLGEAEKVSTVGKSVDGNTIFVVSNPDAYRSCFIKKNHIEEFAKISVFSSKSHIDKLAILLGLHAFQDFANAFPDTFDEKYLTLYKTEENELKEEITKLKLQKEELHMIESNIEKQAKREEAIVLLLNNPKILNLNDVQLYLSGEDGTTGILGELKKKELQIISENFETDLFKYIQSSIAVVKELISLLVEKTSKFIDISMELNYNELYLLIKRIGFYNEMDQVVSNPLEQENIELEQIQQLLTLQSDITSTSNKISVEVERINTKIQRLNQIFKMMEKDDINFSELSVVSYTGMNSISSWKKQLEKELEEYSNISNQEEDYLTLIMKYNLDLDQKRKDKRGLEADLEKYSNMQQEQIDIALKLSELEKEKELLVADIEIMERYIQEKTSEADKENKKIEFNCNMKNSYDKLIPQLKKYKDNLILEQVKDLSEKSKYYYNSIISLGSHLEKLNELHIPNTSDEKIMIRFHGETKEYEAFEVLSESNMKVLGLSILLSKIASETPGFIIFDDIVDNLDAGQRDGVADLLLNNEELREKQIIIIGNKGSFIHKLEETLCTTY